MKTKKLIIRFLVFISFLFLGIRNLSSGNESTTRGVAGVALKPVTLVYPVKGEKAYQIAGEAFVDLWKKITDQNLTVNYLDSVYFGDMEMPEGDVILIGSDAVNPLVHKLIFSGTLDSLGIKYRGDNYRMLSLTRDGRTILILAGGSGRSTIYSVYDFFRQQAGVEYFWDGDVIPHRDQIKLTGLDVLEVPRFEYRGLRYFGHRGLHRFQAEHWDLEDWKKEIDWLMKKRFNLFMLRTDIDDLFQRAFPNDVPYPPVDAQNPDAIPRSYYDRTTFWPLRYRGELRKQVLQYARDRGLVHPEDIGGINHWYSACPTSFYKNTGFPYIKTDQKTGYFWDKDYQVTWDTYWKLTETHIKEFGGGKPRLFHTIGLAEKMMDKSPRDNLEKKRYEYRRFQELINAHYPDVPMLIASWDLIGWGWTNEEVQHLIREFDPKRSILLDYAADMADKHTYREWDVYKKFPWIFGMLHSFARNSDIHGDYNILASRLKDANEDDKCVGLVAWSELSHNDTYMLEYLGNKSWKPQNLDIEKSTEYFCNSRYSSETSPVMKEIWNSFLLISRQFHWSHGASWNQLYQNAPHFRILTSGTFINLTSQQVVKLEEDYKQFSSGLKNAHSVLKGLAILSDHNYDNSLWRRDAIDMARTIAERAFFVSLAHGACRMEAWRQKKADPAEIRQIAKLNRELLAIMSEILSLSDDFSMYASLQKFSDAKELSGIQPLVNPHSELTLKGNAETDYCRSHHNELVQYVYRPELDVYWNYVLGRIKKGDRTEWKRPSGFSEKKKVIADRFYNTPLKEMAPAITRNPENLSDILTRLDKLLVKMFEINSVD